MSDEKKEDEKKEVTENAESKKGNMKKEKVKGVEVKEEKSEPADAKKKKKIILFSTIGGVVALLLVLVIVLAVNLSGKPSKKASENLVKDFLEAVNDKDGDDFVKLVDAKGYAIYNEEKESKFNDKYKKKDEYFKRYQKKNDFDDAEDVDDFIASTFKSSISSQLGSQYTYSSYECSLKEITEINKSKKSNKLIIIKAKVKIKSTYSSDVKTLRLYTIKTDGKYKIVGYEFV